jgi:hypothetical protein
MSCPSALQFAIDPACIALEALDGYHVPEPGNGNKVQPGANKNKDSGALAN